MVESIGTPGGILFERLLQRSLFAAVGCAVLVVFCFYFVDRPVAFFVHRHEIPRLEEFRWLTEPPPLVQSWSPLVLIALAVRRAFGPWRRWQHVLFVACVSLIVADQFRESLGDLCGRYWPETWRDNNPSLIGTGAYGFHPFQVGDDIGSFPSGHAARISAFVAVLWLGLPRGRWFYAIIAVPMLVALVAMNYHFVSDVIAGATL
ncbi:MAG TPA: phosphatase PAP2 family protein, partial [Lacipirellulaceae bacterium]|nr:phosphatase PAP2 family protein [Lacipirellulaceae bacterium]